MQFIIFMSVIKKKNTFLKTRDQRRLLIRWFLKWILGVGFSLGLLIALLVLLVRLGVFGTLPGYETLRSIENNTASEVFSADGKLMGRFYFENRLTINNKDISTHVINALIATEDKRYFEHEGVDYLSLGRVMFKSILMGKRAQGGGSTISQQLARNLFPRSGNGWWHLTINKTKEVFTAIRLERIYAKEDILNLYLNTVSFGENVFGIETAAQRFFSTSSALLNPAQAATLIGMLAANTAYNPRLYPEKSMIRRNLVLKRMQEQGFLNKEEYNKWIRTPLDIRYRKIDQNTGIAPYFRDYLERVVLNIINEQHADSVDLYTDGLRIYTSIDSRLQEIAEAALQAHMQVLQNDFVEHWANEDPWKSDPEFFSDKVRNSARYKHLKSLEMSDTKAMEAMKESIAVFPEKSGTLISMSPLDSIRRNLLSLHAGFLAVDPAEGQILVWIGGVDHQYYQYDHVTSKRQVGSTFKPIVYAAALQNGMKPCDFISNEQRLYNMYEGWSPSNADGNHEGYYSLKGGLTHSVNTISAELIVRIGPETVVDLAQQMGIQSDIPVVPSIALGSAELSLMDMITAYTCFLHNGTYIEPWGLQKIEDRNGALLYQHSEPSESEPALDRETTQLMVEILRHVVDSGTAQSLRSVYNIKADLAGKTGTTQDNGDGWFIGFTPSILTGAWVGAEYPTIHFRTTDLGQGAHTALPIVGRFFQTLEQDPLRASYSSGSFPPLPDELARLLDCSDYSVEDPSLNFFERLFKRNTAQDSVRMQQRIERRAEREEYKKQLEEDGITGIKQTFKLIFGKKRNIESTDTIRQ